MGSDRINYNRPVKEHFIYGAIAGILYIIPSWIFFILSDYEQTWILFFGSVLFMFVIMRYAYKLSRQRKGDDRTWQLIVAAGIAVLIGIVISLLLTVLLCFIYIPGFLSGHSVPVVENVPTATNSHNSGVILILFVCATIENFGAAGFMAVLGPYVFKKNQKGEPSS